MTHKRKATTTTRRVAHRRVRHRRTAHEAVVGNSELGDELDAYSGGAVKRHKKRSAATKTGVTLTPGQAPHRERFAIIIKIVTAMIPDRTKRPAKVKEIFADSRYGNNKSGNMALAALAREKGVAKESIDRFERSIV